MKINVGCGRKALPGYVNVDIDPNSAAGVLAPADKLPFEDASLDEVLAIHLVEHFYSWEVPVLIKEWARVLRPGGLLVVELPNVLLAARNLVEGLKVGKHPDQGSMWAIYGDDTLENPLMMHKSGWWPERLAKVISPLGFSDVREFPTVFHPVGRHVRDFRLEATRAASK